MPLDGYEKAMRSELNSFHDPIGSSSHDPERTNVFCLHAFADRLMVATVDAELRGSAVSRQKAAIFNDHLVSQMILRLEDIVIHFGRPLAR